MPKVAVIVVIYNGAGFLPELLSSLQNTTYPPDDWDLLLVDNNSQDNSIALAKELFPQAKLFPQKENLGFAAANNLAMSYALDNGYDYIFLLNHDTVVTPGWLEPLVNRAESNKEIGAVQSKLMLAQKKDHINTVGNRIHFLGFGYGEASGQLDRGKYEQARMINYPSGAAVLYRAEALRSVGLFAPQMFMYLEDLDLGWRLWLAGYQCWLDPRSIIYHKFEFSRGMTKVYYFERNRWLCILRDYHWATLILLFPALLMMEIGQLLFAIKNGWSKDKIRSYVYFTDPLVWSELLGQRRQIQNQRHRTDAQMLAMFTGEILYQELASPLLLYVANPIFKFYLTIMRWLIRW
ncbi:MAG: glycosyltransferase family 2 protein [Candidatus Komeilibacteria bacterium]